MNIGQERDFYAIRDITEKDIQYLIAMTEHRHGGALNEHNSELIALYEFVSKLRNVEDADQKIQELLIQFEENIMGHIENDGIQYMEMMHKGEVGFFSEDEHRAKFSFFAMIQFVRTKRMSEIIKNLVRESLGTKGVNIDNVWLIEKHIDAGHMALSLFSDKRYEMYLLRNETEVSFISGDQPIFNIHGVGVTDCIPSEVEFYYPISPVLAVMISKNEYPPQVTLDQVNKYNSLVKQMAYEQIYARDESLL